MPFFRCENFGTNFVWFGSYWKQANYCLYYQVHPNVHSELNTNLLEKLLESIRGCRLHLQSFNNNMKIKCYYHVFSTVRICLQNV